MSFTENVKNSLSWVTLKWHLSIGDFVVYIDTGGPVPNIPSKSRGLADEKKKFLTEWKWFETTILLWNKLPKWNMIPSNVLPVRMKQNTGNQYWLWIALQSISKMKYLISSNVLPIRTFSKLLFFILIYSIWFQILFFQCLNLGFQLNQNSPIFEH